MTDVLTLEQAEDLAARTLAAIAYRHRDAPCTWRCAPDLADRERVASDLAGLREHERRCCSDGRRYEDGLRRTAALYGVTP
jgi:hypothetical protein